MLATRIYPEISDQTPGDKKHMSFITKVYGKPIYLLFMVLLLMSCIEKFYPSIDEYDHVLVIDGALIKGDSLQKVLISYSTEISNPVFVPLAGCRVEIRDRSGNIFLYTEQEAGVYTAVIADDELRYATDYQLNITTPYGEEYHSDYVRILENSPIDSIYHAIEFNQATPEFFEKGLQFYADLKAPNEATKNYLWKVEETWEIHTSYGIQGFFEKGQEVDPVFDPWYGKYSVCWNTRELPDYFTASTEKLIVNEKKKIPLSFLPASSPKINERYSVLVKQYSLSDAAYQFHSSNIFASSGSEGLYSKQPAQTKSNIHNVNDPDKAVLGFFWASAYTSSRIFVDGPITTYNDGHCADIHPIILGPGMTLTRYLQLLNRDVYLVALEFGDEGPSNVTLWGYPFNEECINCRAKGGSTIKPDFWE